MENNRKSLSGVVDGTACYAIKRASAITPPKPLVTPHPVNPAHPDCYGCNWYKGSQRDHEELGGCMWKPDNAEFE